MFTFSAVVMTGILMVVTFLNSGKYFGQKKNSDGVSIFLVGLVAFGLFVYGTVQITKHYAGGNIARDAGINELKVNTPYAMEKAVEVPITGGSVHLVFLCNVYNEESATACDSDPTKWLVYQFPHLPPPYFLKLKDGTYKEISLEDVKLLRETAR